MKKSDYTEHYEIVSVDHEYWISYKQNINAPLEI
jgi:hypothetical protein